MNLPCVIERNKDYLMKNFCCTKCGVEKPVEEFSKTYQNKRGFKSWCKECVKEYSKNYYRNPKNYARIRKKMHEYKALNKERFFGYWNSLRLKRPEIIKKYNANQIARRRELRKKRMVDLKTMLGGKCTRCGYDAHLKILEFHHKDPSQKKFLVPSLYVRTRWEKLVEEAQKCELLCPNCHRTHHFVTEKDEI